MPIVPNTWRHCFGIDVDVDTVVAIDDCVVVDDAFAGDVTELAVAALFGDANLELLQPDATAAIATAT